MMAVSRPRLSDNTARPTLGDAQTIAHVLDRLASPCRAQKFPEAASFRMALSSA
jgi:hypothetical protein